MKILTITNTIFTLPDEFSGTLPDALRLLADYIESPVPDLDSGLIPSALFAPEVWNDYLDVIDKGGKVRGTFGVQELVDGEWVIKPREGV